MKKVLPQICWEKIMKIELDSAIIENRQRCGEDIEIEVSGLHLMCDKVFIDASSDSKVRSL